MSRSANPVTIGSFVIGAVIIAIAAVGLLASGVLFSDYKEYVSYFNESVNGLSVGAPVKFRGIAMGEVTKIGLFADANGTAYAEVVLRVEFDRWTRLGGDISEVTEQNVERVVREGLRSRLEVESIVTGVVFVTLEIREDAGPPVFVNPESHLVEIPTAPSPMSELTESAGEVIARLSNVDVNAISDNLIELTESVNNKILEADVAGISDNLVAVTDQLRLLLEEGELRNSIRELTSTLQGIQATNAEVRERVAELETAFARIDTIAANLQEGSAQLVEIAKNSNEMLDGDAEFRVELERAVKETALAMKSVRRLADMLERNPRALLTGKSENRK